MRRLALPVLALLLATSAAATTVRRHSLDSLAGASDLLVRGRVTALTGHAPADRHPYRLARLEVLEDLGGGAPAALWVRLPGGTDARGRAWVVPGVPDPAPGEEWLLFLEEVPEAEARRPAAPPPAAYRSPAGHVAAPASGPPARRQYLPVALSLSVWRVEGGRAVPVPGARALGRAGPQPAGEALPGAGALEELRERTAAAFRRSRPERP